MPAKAPQAFPSPAAVHDGEADILARVIANLADHDAKLVYADWLEERDDARGPLLRDFVQAFRAGKKKLPNTKDAPEGWHDLVGLKYMELLHQFKLAHKADGFLALARPAITYKPSGAKEKSFAVGASRIGGRPDLPPETEWPDFEGFWLSFIAQINLAELRPSPVARELPATGVLSFFCIHDEEIPEGQYEEGSFRVLYHPDTGALARRDFPEGLAEEAAPNVQRFTFAEAQTIPDLQRCRQLKALVKGKEEEKAFDDVHFNMLPNDHLLGHPGMLKRPSTRANRHLITLGDLDGWIDDDVMYFLVSEADLKRANFARAKMELRQF